MVTAEQVRKLYADWNDAEAEASLSEEVLEATAHYANMCELSAKGESVEKAAILNALDVLRLVESGEFEFVGLGATGARKGYGVMQVFDGEADTSTAVFESRDEKEIRDILATTDNFYAVDQQDNTLGGPEAEWQIAGKDFT